MSRILLAWELGLNFGHLTRLAPLAMRLKMRGHMVLGAVRDIQSAALIFEPNGIPFVQAPHLDQEIRLTSRVGSYADILLSQGWGDRTSLWGLVHGWLNLFKLYKPDLLVADYSPTALLAARIAGIKVTLIGNGFELPPATAPMPPFPSCAWATQDKASTSEYLALANANMVLDSLDGSSIHALQDLFLTGMRLLVTFPELDHYGAREHAHYLGPLLWQPKGESMTWPPGPGERIFAYLRPETYNVETILAGLAASGAQVVCVAPGFTQEQLERFRNPHIVFAQRPVALRPLLQSANACVSYGAEGTAMACLLAGVPQLIVPRYMEGYLAARRIEEWGGSMTLYGRQQTAEDVILHLERLIKDPYFKTRAQAFANKYRDFNTEHAADTIIELLERALTENANARVFSPDFFEDRSQIEQG